MPPQYIPRIIPPNSIQIQSIIIDNSNSDDSHLSIQQNIKTPNQDNFNSNIQNSKIIQNAQPVKSSFSEEKDQLKRNFEDSKKNENPIPKFGNQRTISDNNLNNNRYGCLPESLNPSNTQQNESLNPKDKRDLFLEKMMPFGNYTEQINPESIPELSKNNDIDGNLSMELNFFDKKQNSKLLNPNMKIPTEDPESAIFLSVQNQKIIAKEKGSDIPVAKYTAFVPKPQSEKEINILNEPFFQQIGEGSEVQESIILKNSTEFYIQEKGEFSSGKTKLSPNINQNLINPDKGSKISPQNNEEMQLPVHIQGNSLLHQKDNSTSDYKYGNLFNHKISKFTESPSKDRLDNQMAEGSQEANENLKILYNNNRNSQSKDTINNQITKPRIEINEEIKLPKESPESIKEQNNLNSENKVYLNLTNKSNNNSYETVGQKISTPEFGKNSKFLIDKFARNQENQDSINKKENLLRSDQNNIPINLLQFQNKEKSVGNNAPYPQKVAQIQQGIQISNNTALLSGKIEPYLKSNAIVPSNFSFNHQETNIGVFPSLRPDFPKNIPTAPQIRVNLPNPSDSSKIQQTTIPYSVQNVPSGKFDRHRSPPQKNFPLNPSINQNYLDIRQNQIQTNVPIYRNNFAINVRNQGTALIRPQFPILNQMAGPTYPPNFNNFSNVPRTMFNPQLNLAQKIN